MSKKEKKLIVNNVIELINNSIKKAQAIRNFDLAEKLIFKKMLFLKDIKNIKHNLDI